MCNLYPLQNSEKKPISVTVELPPEKYEVCLKVAMIKRVSVQQVIAEMGFQGACDYLNCHEGRHPHSAHRPRH
jgi:hypothetical protein